MKRRHERFLTITVMTGLVTALEACGGTNLTTPTTPSTTPKGPTFTISGVVTEYRGGPLKGVSVQADACTWFLETSCGVVTDAQGHYSLAVPLGVVSTSVSVR